MVSTLPDTVVSVAIIEAAIRLCYRGADGGAPVEKNGVGLNRLDYPVVDDILTVVYARQEANRDQGYDLLRVMRKYSRQLSELGYTLDDLQASIRLLPDIVDVEEDEIDGDEADYLIEEEPAKPGLGLGIPQMDTILGPAGVIASSLPGYESRPSQVALAQSIADAIEGQEHSLAEAGTGTGKSLAYLIAAIYSGRKTVVSTEGKALQDQLAGKDLPFLQQVLPKAFSFAVLKGISNYLCRHKLEEAQEQAALDNGGKLSRDDELALVQEWLATTTSGDLAELSFNLSPEARTGITTTSDECLGAGICPMTSSCFVLRARDVAKQANIVVVNHSLLSLDLAVRNRTSDGVSILPDRDLIVIDEAHSLEDVATKAFTFEATNWSVGQLLRGKMPILAQIPDALMSEAREASENFFASFDRDQRLSFTVTPSEDLKLRAERVRGTLNRVEKKAKETGNLAETAVERKKLERYASRVAGLTDIFGILAEPAEQYVLYVERSRNARSLETTALKAAPISVAPDLRSALWSRWPTIATSATLSTHGGLGYFRDRTGCDDGREVLVDSPFDYQRNGLLYLPPVGKDFDPSLYRLEGTPQYFDRLADEIEELVHASSGRAFCLFTSRKAMDEVWARIGGRMRWPMYKQGDYSPQTMVRKFKDDGNAILFGLRTFWAGVDVQGEALSLVTIDKLPFPTPDEPVYQARCDQINAATGDKWAWFNQLALPLCAIQFKQGAGRLIRSKTDRGVLALLDGRLTTKGYGKGIIASLPPFRQTRSMTEVQKFFAV